MHGWLVIDKEVGPSSSGVVGRLKRALREGGYPRLKIGHGGTLDPLASGVLPIALGEATKLCGRMLDSDKAYEFTLAFGTETDSLDAEGAPVERSEVRPSAEEVAALLPRFTGEQEQLPPAFSALKVDGKRAYARARAGEAVTLMPRRIRIISLELLAADGVQATFAATVSKGTYVRSLARDLARALGTVGHVAMLRRTRAGPFALHQAISLDKSTELIKARRLEQILLPLTAGLDDIPALSVTPDQARLLHQGQKAIGIAAQPGLHLAIQGDVPVALVEAGPGSEIRVVRGFNLWTKE